MGTRGNRTLRPKDWLEPGEAWITEEQGVLTHAGQRFLAERKTFNPGALQEDAPPEVHLLQSISLRLRKAVHDKELERRKQGTDNKMWSFRRLARDADLSTRTLSDLKDGESWPSIKTVAVIEMVLDTMLWDINHRELHRARKEPEEEWEAWKDGNWEE